MNKSKSKKASNVFGNWWFWAVVCLCTAVIACAAIIALIPKKNPENGDQSMQSVSTDVGEKIGILNISDTFTLSVSSDYTRPYMLYKEWDAPSSGNEYIAFYVMFTNLSNSNHNESYDKYNFHLEKSNGDMTPVKYIVSDYADKYLDTGLVKPGEAVGGLIVFEIEQQETIKGLSLKYIDLDHNTTAAFNF